MKYFVQRLMFTIERCTLNASLLCFMAFSFPTFSGPCVGRFVNPVTDICWSCLFPITIGGISVVPGDKEDTDNPGNPICTCTTPFPRVGINVGFWEPVRLVDVTRTPFCFVNLGGAKLSPSFQVGQGAVESDEAGSESSSYHVHWYVYPVLYILNLLMDFLCLESSGLDVGYVTELDPLWQNDELTFILNPEAILFANPIAQAACAADCVAASSGFPLNPLFWCGGCQGSLYPLNGRIQNHIGGVQASLLATERMTYKLHRMGLLWGSIGVEGLCGKYPMPIMKKSQYKSQSVYPIPSTSGSLCCNPYGRTTTLYEMGREFPIKGEDFGWMIWRKRSCCVL